MAARRRGLVALSLAVLLLAAQGGAAQARQATAKRTGAPVTSLALDGARVAYAGGGKVHVWNMATGATSVVKGKYTNGRHTVNATQIAIAGKRVAWLRDQQFGKTEEGENLYTASVGGTARQVKHVYRYGVDDPALTKGAGSTVSSVAESTWSSAPGSRTARSPRPSS